MNLDRNIVIEAGAGTGKTYALVQMVLRALFEKSLPMESLVALTFTKKAAGEMKERIAGALRDIIRAKTLTEPWRVWGRSLDDLQKIAQEALESIDRAAISTIHSYAYSLLKRFPLAAGISADAEVDEKGVKGDDLFDQEWPVWLARELGRIDKTQEPRDEGRDKAWLDVLGKAGVPEIRALARRLADFDVPLERLPLSDANLPKDLAPYLQEVRDLLAGRPEQKATRIASACEEVMGAACSGHCVKTMDIDIRRLIDEEPTTTQAWPPEDIKRLKFLQNLARNLILGGDSTVRLLTELLLPFIARLRARMLAEGCLSNNALLSLARELVAAHSRTRETLKREIRLMLVDEFQDTDPLQGELLMFLAEKPGSHAKRWQNVELEPGKLFLVGDPKQSIYRFRGADIAAYRKITQHVLAQGGRLEALSQSRRSHEGIIHVVNAAFERLIEEKDPFSPAYQPLEPLRPCEAPERQYVELRLAAAESPMSSDDALEREAQDAAAWIAAQTAGGLAYKDIALVFRSAPAMPPFIEALRRRRIPFVVESERYFYGSPEVTDVLNLLRALAEPGDRLALAGFLRSPLGGFSDPELALLQQKNGLRLDRELPPELNSPAHHGAWQLLRDLVRRVGREPLKALLRHVYQDTFLLELAERSYHQDQTVANLLKLKRLMESFAEEGVTTLEVLLAKIDRWMEDDRLEGESPLADEGYDAVRLMTIHKAKGLEFPVVWLPGLHKGRQGNDPDTDAVRVLYDWSTGRLGIRMGRKGRNLGHFILEEEADRREDAEERRVLYVAMTRARERLILSGGINLHRPSKDSPLRLLAGAWEKDMNHLPEGRAVSGKAVLQVHLIAKGALPSQEETAPKTPGRFNPYEIAARWKRQEEACRQAAQAPLVLTPSRASTGEPPPDGAAPSPRPRYGASSNRDDGNAAATLGTLVHRFLEQWDFSCGKGEMPARLRRVADGYFALLGPNDPMTTFDEMVEEAQKMLAGFIGSAAYDEIKNATIIARELPFFYPTTGPFPALMRGAIDILYRLPGGALIVGDYKTDRMPASHHQTQIAFYQEAVERALGEKAQGKLIYVRAGEAAATPDKKS